MKSEIAAALDLLKEAQDDVRPGGQSEVKFKRALVSLQSVVDTADPPAQEDQTMTLLTAINDKLDGMEDALAAFISQQPAPSA